MDPILQRARDGDPMAWPTLVDQNGALLRRYLDRRMGSKVRRTCSSGDLAQEVLTRMLQALRAAPDDATERTFRRWLLRHADWVLADKGLAARRHVGESVAGGAGPAGVGAQQPTTGDVTRRDQIAWLHALLDRLDPKYAAVVRLRLEGASFPQLATQLGLAEAAVRQRLSRVLRLLAEARGAGG